jgi:hypothetical protein
MLWQVSVGIRQRNVFAHASFPPLQRQIVRNQRPLTSLQSSINVADRNNLPQGNHRIPFNRCEGRPQDICS